MVPIEWFGLQHGRGLRVETCAQFNSELPDLSPLANFDAKVIISRYFSQETLQKCLRTSLIRMTPSSGYVLVKPSTPDALYQNFVQYPWPKALSGIERVACSSMGDLQRMLRYLFMVSPKLPQLT
jgi:hypothetical protein